MAQNAMSALRKNVPLGLAFGLVVATAYSAWVTLLRLTQGPSPFDQTGTAYGQTVLIYYAGFAVGGVLAGALWSPLHRWAVGWAVMGFILVVPIYALLAVSNPGEARWRGWNAGFAVGASAVVGGVAGLQTWSGYITGWHERPTNWRFVLAVLVIGGLLAGAMYLAWW